MTLDNTWTLVFHVALYFQIILESGMPFRVYAPANHMNDIDYALEVGKSVLQMYEVMFDLPFPLPKSGEILFTFIFHVAYSLYIHSS